jgi:hypothetical protein
MDTNGRCCVFQPFDKGRHDKRYDDTVAPAIQMAGLEPYRVDRDAGAIIPIDTLHEEIRAATVCLADISTQNPNVMYELGFAIASGKNVVIICSNEATTFPFDIQHRGVIQCASDSASDFDKLKAAISNRLRALLKKQATTQEIASASPVKATHGLQPNEIAALALVMANIDSSSDRVATSTVKQDMENAGYTRLATQLALTRLARMSFVQAVEDSDYNSNPFVSYQILAAGEDWLLENQDKLELRVSASPSRQRNMPVEGVADDDVPF